MGIFTVALTVITGVAVFVIGQMTLKLLIEPIQQFKKTLAGISHLSVQYAYAIHNPSTIEVQLKDKVFEKLRHSSGQLYADLALIPWYGTLRGLFSLPPKQDVYKGAQNLIATANWMMISRDDNRLSEIIRSVQAACDNLGLYTDPADRVPEEFLKT